MKQYAVHVDREIFVVKFFSWSSQKTKNLTREINSTTYPQCEQKHGEFSSRKRQVRFLQHGFQGSRIKKEAKLYDTVIPSSVRIKVSDGHSIDIEATAASQISR